MTDEMESGKVRSWPYRDTILVLAGMYRVKPRDNRCSCQDSTLEPPEYESRMLPLDQPLWSLLDQRMYIYIDECSL
jgi:hypothetical protein